MQVEGKVGGLQDHVLAKHYGEERGYDQIWRREK
jgi:hypothetical protein